MAMLIQTKTGNNSAREKQAESRKQDTETSSKKQTGIPSGAVYIMSNAAPGI